MVESGELTFALRGKTPRVPLKPGKGIEVENSSVFPRGIPCFNLEEKSILFDESRGERRTVYQVVN